MRARRSEHGSPLPRIALVFLILSPLIYAFDNDPYRTYELLGVAAIGGGLFLVNQVRGLRLWQDMALVVTYGVVLIVQQFFINSGSPTFGAQYAIAMTAMFVPTIAVRAVPLYGRDFARAADLAMNALGGITVVSIYASFFLGIGETYTGPGLTRAFGWLGDSFTPIIVFLVLYFTFQKRWMRTGALLGALVMTGGKAGMLMLAATPVLFVLVSPAPTMKKIGIACAIVATGLLINGSWDTFTAIFLQNGEYSYNHRAISIEFGIQYFLDNPWFGVGINQSMKTIGGDTRLFIDNMRVNSYYIDQISNAFVRTAAETGVFGFGIFVAMCGVWITRSLRILSRVYGWRTSQERSLAMAGGLWTVSFILLYQSTGWFEVGHPQLAWLLMISAVAEAAYRRGAATRLVNLRRRAPLPGRVPILPPAGNALR